jgi:flagellar basal-body rod protein FlgB
VELFDTSLLAIERALVGASLRQRALANNLANANTPGFKRSDVDFHGVLAKALDDGVEGPAVSRVGFSLATDTRSAMRADGNNVDVDVETASLAENALDYQALVAVARARLQTIRSAIGVR